MRVSRSITNIDVVAMIGTIVFKEAECTSGNQNVKRLWPGSNRLRVVVKPKYCRRVDVIRGLRFITLLIPSTNCSRRKRKFLV